MNDILIDTYFLRDGTSMPRGLRDDPRIDQASKEAALAVAHALPGRGDVIELWSVCLSADERAYVLRARSSSPFLDCFDIERLLATGHVHTLPTHGHGISIEVRP